MRLSRRRQVFYAFVATLFGATCLNHVFKFQRSTSLRRVDNTASKQKRLHVKSPDSNTTIPVVKQEKALTPTDMEETSQSTERVLEPGKELDKLLKYLKKQSRVRCKALLYIGKLKPLYAFEEGTFPVCVDNDLFHKTGKCLVYSYGINDIWGFDDGMAELFGCEDHTFDAHMYSTDEHRRSRNVWFHRKDISNRTSDSVYRKGKNDIITRDKWGRMELERRRVVKTRTLASAMVELGHVARVVDVLRIDGESTDESYEFDVISNLLDADTVQCVRQLTVEVHLFSPCNDTRCAANLKHKLNILRRLEASGFKLLDFQMPVGFQTRRVLLGPLGQDEEPVTFVMLWGNPQAKSCVNQGGR